MSFLIISKFKQINKILFPPKSSENHRFSDDFRGNKSYVIRFNSLLIRSKFRDDLLSIYSNVTVDLFDLAEI